jgi:3-methyladenine DNA glycosylase AlkD
VIYIVEALKNDEHIHIKKGIGWLLKCSYKTYNQEVIDYLKSNYKLLPRTTFRYALEKMPIELKKELMALFV